MITFIRSTLSAAGQLAAFTASASGMVVLSYSPRLDRLVGTLTRGYVNQSTLRDYVHTRMSSSATAFLEHSKLPGQSTQQLLPRARDLLLRNPMPFVQALLRQSQFPALLSDRLANVVILPMIGKAGASGIEYVLTIGPLQRWAARAPEDKTSSFIAEAVCIAMRAPDRLPLSLSSGTAAVNMVAERLPNMSIPEGMLPAATGSLTMMVVIPTGHRRSGERPALQSELDGHGNAQITNLPVLTVAGAPSAAVAQAASMSAITRDLF